ncbi:MAG: riboflavin kinase, partial [bacterium]
LQFNEKLARTGAEDFIRLYLKSSLGMKALVEGEDHRFGFKSEGDMKLHKNLSTIYEYDIILVPTFHINGYPVKSGKIRELIEKGEIVQAKRMLGGGYIIKGKVVPGDKIGRKLGFPTANISVCEDKLLPADGVYLVKTTINSTTYHGLLYIGYRPTITDKKEKRTELYLFNFNGELYNLALKVELIMKIREDRYFEDIQLLRKQMEEDRTYAMKLIKGPGGIND